MEEEVQRKNLNILITGTPGTGKTTLSRLLVEHLENFNYINVGQAINENKLYSKWNDEFNVSEFDEEQVCQFLSPYVSQGGLIVDFHTSEIFPDSWFDVVVLLRTNNTVLYDRLKARGYNDKKISENIECEILEVTSEEVYEHFSNSKILELQNELESQMQININTIIQKLLDIKSKNVFN